MPELSLELLNSYTLSASSYVAPPTMNMITSVGLCSVRVLFFYPPLLFPFFPLFPLPSPLSPQSPLSPLSLLPCWCGLSGDEGVDGVLQLVLGDLIKDLVQEWLVLRVDVCDTLHNIHKLRSAQ